MSEQNDPVQRTLRVHQKRYEAEGITSVTLVDPSGAPLPSWKPGAHLALHLPGGIVREYSLCSDPADSTGWTVAVLRTLDSRGGSEHVHDRLSIGVEIPVDGPRENFALDADRSAGSFLIAGGIGITPIITMARELAAGDTEWGMLYTGRSRSQMAFLDEVEGFGADRVSIHVDEEAGTVPDIAAILGSLAPGTIVYCCGPIPLMDAVAENLPDAGSLRLERFKAPERVIDPEADADQAFDVVLDSSGQRVRVDADISILDALAGAGVSVPSSCMEGICGTCETTVISGDIDHRDFLLSDEEKEAGETMCICVSRCRGPELVLDL